YQYDKTILFRAEGKGDQVTSSSRHYYQNHRHNQSCPSATPVTQVPSLIMSILPPFARSLSLTIRQWTSLHPTTSASPTLQLQRSYTSAVSNDSDAVTTPSLSEGERHIWDKLTRELNPSKLRVLDVSGGCGSMYAIDITSDAFQGVPMVKQHRIVNEILKEEIKEMHGIQNTMAGYCTALNRPSVWYLPNSSRRPQIYSHYIVTVNYTAQPKVPGMK
ncbi:bola protein, partial [Jimgerdemannia flammicorona]